MRLLVSDKAQINFYVNQFQIKVNLVEKTLPYQWTSVLWQKLSGS